MSHMYVAWGKFGEEGSQTNCIGEFSEIQINLLGTIYFLTFLHLFTGIDSQFLNFCSGVYEFSSLPSIYISCCHNLLVETGPCEQS